MAETMGCGQARMALTKSPVMRVKASKPGISSLVSGPMIGFDPDGVAKAFNLSANDIPAMLIAVGYSAPDNWPQKPRLPIKDVLTIL
jgi:hypothetical protein